MDDDNDGKNNKMMNYVVVHAAQNVWEWRLLMLMGKFSIEKLETCGISTL